MAMEVDTVLMEPDKGNYKDLRDQLLQARQPEKSSPEPESEMKEEKSPRRSEEKVDRKSFTFRKGDQTFDVDEDAEIEFMADKRPMKLTLRELKDRAAGDVAVKNRMHTLAEEKKRVQSTFKEFAKIAKEDPLSALEYISNKAKEADSDFEYNTYLNKLAEQAERLGQMDDKDRKAWELDKKLKKAEQDLSLQQREKAVVLRKQEILTDYPEIGDQKFGQMVEAVLNHPDLSEGLQDEHDVMDRVEELIEETLAQREIMRVIQDVDPSYINDNELIFSLSDQLKQNPDLDEEDVRDIIRELIGPSRQQVAEKQQAVRRLSEKQRSSAPMDTHRTRNASDFDILRTQLMERREQDRDKNKRIRR